MTTPYTPPPRSWRTRLREVFTERLGLKAIALLLSVLLWLVVQARKPASRGYTSVGAAPVADSARRAPMRSEGRAATTASASDGARGLEPEEARRQDTGRKVVTPSLPHPLTSAPSPAP